jgi:hypothetical protein
MRERQSQMRGGVFFYFFIFFTFIFTFCCGRLYSAEKTDQEGWMLRGDDFHTKTQFYIVI